jgi:uncharacterized membrane protein YhiD involved in acid resistance
MGMALGYGLSAVFQAADIPWLKWSVGFYIQAALMIVVVTLMFLVVPSVNFSHEHEALMEHEERTASINEERKANTKKSIHQHALSEGNVENLKVNKGSAINEYQPPTMGTAPSSTNRNSN